MCNKTTVVCPESIPNSFALQYKNNIINGNCAKIVFLQTKSTKDQTFYGVRQLKDGTWSMIKSGV